MASGISGGEAPRVRSVRELPTGDGAPRGCSQGGQERHNGPVITVNPDRFEQMVADALDSLPAELGQLMRNVAVTVELDGGRPGLLGLYQGVPLTGRSSWYAGVLPDRIIIYRRAICAICDTEDEVTDQVRRTVIHEVGHHFGIGDKRLRELGW